MKKWKKKDIKILMELCKKNGRYLSINNDGTCRTSDIYDGCDGQTFDDIIEAIEWEKGK